MKGCDLIYFTINSSYSVLLVVCYLSLLSALSLCHIAKYVSTVL